MRAARRARTIHRPGAGGGGMDGTTPLTGPSDTFVEASDTDIQSHTPTGPNAGSAWTLMTGAIRIDAAGDFARDNNSAASNRAFMTNDLGSDQHGVEAQFVNSATAGQSVFFGVGCRVATGIVGIEFLYMVSTGNWRLDDDGGGVVTLTEAWPGGTVTMRVVIQSGVVKGYVNGVEKLSMATSVGAGRTRGSIALLNFAGSVDKVHADNYKSMAA